MKTFIFSVIGLWLAMGITFLALTRKKEPEENIYYFDNGD